MTGAEKMKGLAAIEQDERIALQALMFLLGEPQVKRDNQVPSSTATQKLRRRKTMSNEATARAARKTINPEFQSNPLNQVGVSKTHDIATAFDELLEQIKQWVPDSRELSLVKTHMELASFYANKGVSRQTINQ